MKRFLISCIFVLCAILSWGQALSVVEIGNNVLDKNNFISAKQIFHNNGLSPADRESSTDYVISLGDDSYTACLASIKANTDKTIQEVTFLIGGYYQDRVENDLKVHGYKYLSKKNVTLGNGAGVQQTTYVNGLKQCLIRIVDDFKQVLFKRQEAKNNSMALVTNSMATKISSFCLSGQGYGKTVFYDSNSEFFSLSDIAQGKGIEILQSLSEYPKYAENFIYGVCKRWGNDGLKSIGFTENEIQKAERIYWKIYDRKEAEKQTNEDDEREKELEEGIDKESTQQESDIVEETRPEFPGGDEAFLVFIHKNLKYPKEAWEEGIQGRVSVKFTIDKNGSVVNPRIVRGVSRELDNEAIRVFSLPNMPKWKPATQNGKPVNAELSFPIQFRLPN